MGQSWEAPWGLLRQWLGLWGRLGALLGRLGAVFAVWKVSWDRFGAAERPSWVSLGAIVDQLEALLGLSGPAMSRLGRFWGHFGRLLAHFGARLGPLGAIREASWAVLS